MAGAAHELTGPLTSLERDDFRRRFEIRRSEVGPKMDALFAFQDVDRPPCIVTGAFFWVAGLDPDTLPDDYFISPEAMTNFQERNYYDQLRAIDDDFVPYLMPWFGTGVVASAFGCRIDFRHNQDPAVDPASYPVQTAADVRRLGIPVPGKDGLMPEVLRFQRYMKAHSFLPVAITDFQGPLTTANQLMGYDRLIYLMADEPAAAHELMDKVTEALIAWVKLQKREIGEPLDECIGGHQIYFGSNLGIWFSDDDAVLMSPRWYRDFVVPYNSRILEAFGGGCLHYCGNATHQADNFLATRGLRAINNYTLHNGGAFRELKARLEGRIAAFACDYAPLEPDGYFAALLPGLSYRGLAVLSDFSPVLALLPGGKYEAARRELRAGRREVWDSLRRHLARPRREPADNRQARGENS